MNGINDKDANNIAEWYSLHYLPNPSKRNKYIKSLFPYSESMY